MPLAWSVAKVEVVESSHFTEIGLASTGVTRVQSTMESAIGAPEATPWAKEGSAASAHEHEAMTREAMSNRMVVNLRIDP